MRKRTGELRRSARTSADNRQSFADNCSGRFAEICTDMQTTGADARRSADMYTESGLRPKNLRNFYERGRKTPRQPQHFHKSAANQPKLEIFPKMRKIRQARLTSPKCREMSPKCREMSTSCRPRVGLMSTSCRPHVAKCRPHVDLMSRNVDLMSRNVDLMSTLGVREASKIISGKWKIREAPLRPL